MSEAPSVTVLGYASLDYSMNVTRPPVAGRTSLVTERLSDPWPDCGGAARFVQPLFRRGAEVSVISWVGSDAAGDAWVRNVVAAGGSLVEGSQVEGTSPVSYLIHSGDDLPACVFDPGVSMGTQVQFSPAMGDAVRQSDWCLCSVSPSGAVQAMLYHLPDDSRLAWVVKADPDAFPMELRRLLWQRSTLIVLGEAERQFLAEASLDETSAEDHQSALIVRTAGADSISWTYRGAHGTEPVEPIDATVNTVGAGDVFAGALLGELVARKMPPSIDDIPLIISLASHEARQFLLDRARP